MNRVITKLEARKFLLMLHGLYGERKFIGKDGIMEFVKRTGCIQFDPIDVCGKNHELVLQSRIAGFTKDMIYELLYKDRLLIDWFDKNMSICQVVDWPYFEHNRKNSKRFTRSNDDTDKVADEVLEYIKKNGAVCSADLEYTKKVDWGWAPTSLSRAVLDTLYYRGDIIIHHKKNTRKYYDLATKHIDKSLLNAQNPNRDDYSIRKWQVLRRIGAVGMLHKNASYAFIGIGGLKTKERNEIYKDLLQEGKIAELNIEGIKLPFYYNTKDSEVLEQAISGDVVSNRLEFIAPLDTMLWDRKIIVELFDFDYKWEIYTPIKDRKYGYYVLPILSGDTFIGRIELRRDKELGSFDIINIWLEHKRYNTKKNMNRVTRKLKVFNKMIY